MSSRQDQKTTLLKLVQVIPVLRNLLNSDVATVNLACIEAKVEENDYTVLTVDDLEYELELAEAGIRKKIAFVENQVGAAMFALFWWTSVCPMLRLWTARCFR
jgi:hypothetical protein